MAPAPSAHSHATPFRLCSPPDNRSPGGGHGLLRSHACLGQPGCQPPEARAAFLNQQQGSRKGSAPAPRFCRAESHTGATPQKAGARGPTLTAGQRISSDNRPESEPGAQAHVAVGMRGWWARGAVGTWGRCARQGGEAALRACSLASCAHRSGSDDRMARSRSPTWTPDRHGKAATTLELPQSYCFRPGGVCDAFLVERSPAPGQPAQTLSRSQKQNDTEKPWHRGQRGFLTCPGT